MNSKPYSTLYEQVVQIIRRNNRYVRLLCLALVAVALLIGLFSSRYYYNLLFGPFRLEYADLIEITTPYTHPTRYWFSITGDEAVDTEYEFRTGEGRTERVTASYVSLILRDRQLLVQLPGELRSTPNRAYSGFLMPISNVVRLGVIDEYLAAETNPQGVFFPVMLDVQPLGGWGYAGFGLNLLALLIGLGGIALTTLRDQRVSSSPILRGIARFGDSQTVLAEVEAELRRDALTVGNVALTEHWLVSQSPASFELTRYEDIVWVYKKMTHQSSSGHTYSVLIHDRYGKVMAVRAKELRANEIAALIHQRAPWAFNDYTRDLESDWRFRRTAMLEAVAHRKQVVVEA
jgi:hypothetical protein